MADSYGEAITGLMVVGLILLAVAGEVFQEVRQGQTERFCLAHGYPNADWRWFGDNYCIKRVDQTDIVTPTWKVR